MYLPEGVAILNYSGGQETGCSEGWQMCFFVNKDMHVFAKGGGSFELPSNHDIVVQRESQICFVR